MVRDDELLTDELTDALGRAAEPLGDRARAQIRARVMHEVRADRRGGLFMLASHRVAAAATALAMLGGGVAYAAEQSLPGDPLYGVKIGAENAIVAILPPGRLESRVLVMIAARRAGEAATMARTGVAPDAVDDAIDALRNAVRHATPEEGVLGEEEALRIRRQGFDAPTETRDAIDDAISAPGPAQSPGDGGSRGGTGGGTGTGGTGSTPDDDGTRGGTSGGGTTPSTGGSDGSNDASGTGSGTGGGTGSGDGTRTTSETDVSAGPLVRKQPCETSGSLQPR